MSKGKKRSGARPGRPQPLRGTKGKRKGARLWYVGDRKSGSAGMPRPISYAVFCLKKKKEIALYTDSDSASSVPAGLSVGLLNVASATLTLQYVFLRIGSAGSSAYQLLSACLIFSLM